MTVPVKIAANASSSHRGSRFFMDATSVKGTVIGKSTCLKRESVELRSSTTRVESVRENFWTMYCEPSVIITIRGRSSREAVSKSSRGYSTVRAHADARMPINAIPTVPFRTLMSWQILSYPPEINERSLADVPIRRGKPHDKASKQSNCEHDHCRSHRINFHLRDRHDLVRRDHKWQLLASHAKSLIAGG